MRATTRLRELLNGGPVIAPSIYDGISARLAELAGFDLLHLAGSAVEMSLLGVPDLGLLSLTELTDHAARIAGLVEVPVIADIDAGFGGILNIQRTIREMERAGIAGVHIEDQALPKACPFLAGRQVVGRTKALDRLKAALDARQDPDFVIIARTDADAISQAEVIERSRMFLEAGADVVFPIFLSVDGTSYYELSEDRKQALIRSLPGRIDGPVMYMGVTPPGDMTLFDVAEAGWTITLHATAATAAAASAMVEVFRTVKETGRDTGYFDKHPGVFQDALRLMQQFHLDRHVETEGRFTTKAPTSRTPGGD